MWTSQQLYFRRSNEKTWNSDSVLLDSVYFLRVKVYMKNAIEAIRVHKGGVGLLKVGYSSAENNHTFRLSSSSPTLCVQLCFQQQRSNVDSCFKPPGECYCSFFSFLQVCGLHRWLTQWEHGQFATCLSVHIVLDTPKFNMTCTSVKASVP